MAGPDVESPDEPSEFAALVGELTTLSKLRTMGDVRTARLPVLRACAAAYQANVEPGAPRFEPHPVRSIVTNAIAGIPDPAYREKADALVGFHDHRWEPLVYRYREAGRAFGVGSDGFRRKRREGRPSHRDETLAELARALLHLAGAHQGGDEPAVASTPAQEGTGDRMFPGDLAIDGIDLRSNYPFGVGAVLNPHLPQAAFSDALRRAYHQAERDGCTLSPPSTPALGYGPLLVQFLGPAGGCDAAIVARNVGDAVVLTCAEWRSYRTLALRDGNAYDTAGAPISVHETPGLVVIELDSDSRLVGERADGPFFWVTGLAQATLDRHGGLEGDLGLPRTNPRLFRGSYQQDYSGGVMRLAPGGTVEVIWATEAERTPPSDRSCIIRQWDATAWWVDEDGVRHWIPDGATWYELGGEGALRANGLLGSQVAALTAGATVSSDDRSQQRV